LQAKSISVGCGTAESILEVAADIRDRGISPTVVLIDQDPIALAAARTHAEREGLGEFIEMHCLKLFDRRGRPFAIDSQVLKGRLVDIAEDTGLREYLNDALYVDLSRMIWSRVEEGGMMSTGNMNQNRPQPEFLHGLMGWFPRVRMRKISDGFRLHERSGIPKGSTKARVTRDGVYTLFFSYK
jgi:hypothetical protein